MDVPIPCICPKLADGNPRHAGDTVTLRDALDFRGATSAKKAIVILKNDDPGVDAGEILAVLTEQYLLHGVSGWTVVDEKNKPVEVSKPEIRSRLLTRVDAASRVGDEADALYSEAVLLPLLRQSQTSSPASPTDESTSPPTGSPKKPPKPSKPSSTSTTRTDGIETTISPPDGASSTWPSSALG